MILQMAWGINPQDYERAKQTDKLEWLRTAHQEAMVKRMAEKVWQFVQVEDREIPSLHEGKAASICLLHPSQVEHIKNALDLACFADPALSDLRSLIMREIVQM